MVAGLALSGGVLGEVVVLLGDALLGRADEAAPHGEVDGRHAERGDEADDHAHPLERVWLGQGCNRQQSGASALMGYASLNIAIEQMGMDNTRP